MKGNLHDLTAVQLRSLISLCTDVAHFGTKLAHEWPAHPVRPYITERLTYLAALVHARDENGGIDHHVLYARVFDAKPEGCRYWMDAGLSMRFQQVYDEVSEAIANAIPFQAQKPLSGALRSMAGTYPLPLAAMDRARELRAKHYSTYEAAIGAQRVLAGDGMFPLEPLPVMFETPRQRADGDWLIGAMRRFLEALQTTVDTLSAASSFLERAENVLGGAAVRKDRISLRALPVLAGRPTLRSNDLMNLFEVSQKAALAAMAELEEAGLAREIRGLAKWQVWTAADDVLGLPAPSEAGRIALALPGGKVVSVAA